MTYIIFSIVALITIKAIIDKLFFDEQQERDFKLVDVSCHPLYVRSLEILRSCKTCGQYECAERWQQLAIKKIKRGEV